ncbi:MAG TPA: DNA polymerase IV [Cytophagaceae bacterium]|jgi:DNA polymerase-4|nr:DNA polymerase IV [Cytophagaceae bacterium]
MNTRAILHMDLDSFFVSVERLKNSAFIGKPIIVGGNSNRGVVASCSYETRKFGVHSAMPMRMAKKLCPDAIVISGDMESYSKYSSIVSEIISNRSPVFEKRSIDEFYVDLTGMERFFGCYKWSTEIRQKIIKETGLPISFGLSVNKLVSKMGTSKAKPNGQLQIPSGEERAFIAPMSIQKIPGVGEETTAHLYSMGVKTIKTLREIPVQLLQKEFGKNGTLIWEKANAIDESPVEPYDEQKSISTESTFHSDTTDINFLKSVLVKQSEELAFELRKSQRLTGCITVKVRYSDFNTCTQQKKITLTASDSTLIDLAKQIFDKLYDKRVLVRMVGIRYSHLVYGNPQINLFEDTAESVRLYEAMDKIKNKYGALAIKRAVSSVNRR